MAKRKKTFEDLSFDDLKGWAGDKIVGRAYGYKKQVADLRRTVDGELLAWVSGSRRYATRVRHDGDKLESSCTCPYWSVCKHAVAVVLAYLEAVKAKTAIETAAADDPRIGLLESNAAADDEEDSRAPCFDDDFEDEDDDEDDYEYDYEGEPMTVAGKQKKAKKIRDILSGMSKDELVNFAASLAEGDKKVSRAVKEHKELAGGKINKIIKELRADIEDLTSQPAWKDNWRGRGEIPDYSGVLKRLNMLLKSGHADALMDIGEGLLELGMRQIEQSDDEGETAAQIGECLEVVFKAVPSSSLAPPEQILWMIDAYLADGYGILDGVENPFPARRYSKADWSAVTDEMRSRLNSLPVEVTEDSNLRYKRKHLMDWTITALEKSGRTGELIAILEHEAPIIFCYGRLVDALIQARRIDEARRWAYEGYAKTRKPYAGIAADLVDKLRELAVREKQPLLAAAFRGHEFFEGPSLAAYKNLEKTSSSAKVWQAVRHCALAFLETGRRPDGAPVVKPTGKKGGVDDTTEPQPWPLPSTGLLFSETISRRGFPDTDTLIDIALYEKRNGDAIGLYESVSRRTVFFDPIAPRLADKVQQTHPDAALKIWRSVAEFHIAQTKPKAYVEAAGYLRKMKKVHEELGDLAPWNAYIAQLRVQHNPKPPPMEVLASLEGKRILDM